MPEPGPETLDGAELLRAIRELEARVARIEERLNLAPASQTPPLQEPAGPGAAILFESAGAVPVLGRALLALAGAYLLRALTDSHTMPQSAGVWCGILYAGVWLAQAARTPAAQRAKTAIYSLTSALVLGPLLWEATLRMKAIGTGGAAVILLAFTAFGLLLSWRKNLLIVATIAILTSILTAAALLIGSEDVVPFLFLLLAIAAAVEVSACLDHWLNERWLAAAAADLAVLLATYLVTNERGLPQGYAPIPFWVLGAAQMLLPGIYLSSILVRTLLSGFTFTIFETAQLGLALLLAVGGVLQRGGEPQMVSIVAAVLLGCAVATYGAAFRLKGRNQQTFAAFGFLLLLAGTRLVLPATIASAIWLVLAVGFFAAVRPSLAWHGCLFLLSSLAVSGTLAQATECILGAGPPRAVPAMLAGQLAAVSCCYMFVLRRRLLWRILAVVLPGLAIWIAMAIATLLSLLAPAAFSAVLRTATLAAGAVLLAWSAKAWKRREFVPLVYLAMVLDAYRLMAVDLHEQSKAAIVLSLLVYGAALMLIPRLLQSRPGPPEIEPAG